MLGQIDGDYSISRAPGLGYKSGADLIQTFGALQFEDCLTRFLLSECPAAPLHDLAILGSQYGIYSQFYRTLPSLHRSLHQATPNHFVDRVCAYPAVGKRPAYYDTILYLPGYRASQSPPCTLQGVFALYLR